MSALRRSERRASERAGWPFLLAVLAAVLAACAATAVAQLSFASFAADSATDFMSLPNYFFPNTSTVVSLDLWINTNPASATNRTVLAFSTAAVPGALQLVQQPAPQSGLRVSLLGGAVTGFLPSVTYGVTDGSWHHIGLRFADLAVAVYVDGVLAATLSVAAWPLSGPGCLSLGQTVDASCAATGGLASNYMGSLAELRVWTGAVDFSRRMRICGGLFDTRPGSESLTARFGFALGDGWSSVGLPRAFAVNGAVSFGLATPPLPVCPGLSLRLGGGAYLYNSQFSGLSPVVPSKALTLQMWVRCFPGGGARQSLLSYWTAERGLELEIAANASFIIYRFLNNTATAAVPLCDGLWHFLRTQTSSSNMPQIENRIQLDSTIYALPFATDPAAWMAQLRSGGFLAVGAAQSARGVLTPGGFFNGLLHELQIFSRYLSQAEENDPAHPLSPLGENVEAMWRFDVDSASFASASAYLGRSPVLALVGARDFVAEVPRALARPRRVANATFGSASVHHYELYSVPEEEAYMLTMGAINRFARMSYAKAAAGNATAALRGYLAEIETAAENVFLATQNRALGAATSLIVGGAESAGAGLWVWPTLHPSVVFYNATASLLAGGYFANFTSTGAPLGTWPVAPLLSPRLLRVDAWGGWAVMNTTAGGFGSQLRFAIEFGNCSYPYSGGSAAGTGGGGCVLGECCDSGACSSRCAISLANGTFGGHSLELWWMPYLASQNDFVAFSRRQVRSGARGYMAGFGSANETAFAINMMAAPTGAAYGVTVGYARIGLSDSAEEGVYAYSDGPMAGTVAHRGAPAMGIPLVSYSFGTPVMDDWGLDGEDVLELFPSAILNDVTALAPWRDSYFFVEFGGCLIDSFGCGPGFVCGADDVCRCPNGTYGASCERNCTCAVAGIGCLRGGSGGCPSGSCPPHMYGPNCDVLCPGSTNASHVCSGHGTCSESLGCVCASPWIGAGCNSLPPSPPPPSPPPPVRSPPPPPPVATPGVAAKQDVLSSSSGGQSSPIVIAGYLLAVALLWLIVMALIRRKRIQAKFAADPVHWIKLDISERLWRENILLGVLAVHPQDPFGRTSRLACLTLTLATHLLVSSLLPLLQPSAYASSDSVLSLSQLKATVFALVVSTLVAVLFGTPLLRAGAHSKNRVTRIVSVAFGVLMTLLMVCVVAALFALASLTGYTMNGRAVAASFGLSVFGSVFVFDPITQVVLFAVMGMTHSYRQTLQEMGRKVGPEDAGQETEAEATTAAAADATADKLDHTALMDGAEAGASASAITTAVAKK